MSKFTLRKHVSSFTIVSNSIINELKTDLECLGFYTYILSLPDNWVFYKTQLAKECKIGIKKLERILKRLRTLALVDYGQKRDEKGHFSEFYMDVYDREIIKNNDLDEFAQPDGQICRTAIPVRRSGEAIQETLIQDLKNNKQDKDICASDDAQKSFEQFWVLYPRKKDKKKAFDVWIKNKYHEKSQIIINKLSIQILNDPQWKTIQFVPYATTYLRNARWEDEIDLQRIIERKESGMERAVRLCLN